MNPLYTFSGTGPSASIAVGGLIEAINKHLLNRNFTFKHMMVVPEVVQVNARFAAPNQQQVVYTAIAVLEAGSMGDIAEMAEEAKTIMAGGK
jgi:putative flippase GtrA